MKLLQVTCWSLLFAKIGASIPSKEIIETAPSFEQYLQDLGSLLKSTESNKDCQNTAHFVKDCPYSLGRMTLVLLKYVSNSESSVVGNSSYYSDSKGESLDSVKYMPIMDKLREGFSLMRTEARHTHVSGLEVMFNYSFTEAVRENKENLGLVLEFVDEALIKENPMKNNFSLRIWMCLNTIVRFRRSASSFLLLKSIMNLLKMQFWIL